MSHALVRGRDDGAVLGAVMDKAEYEARARIEPNVAVSEQVPEDYPAMLREKDVRDFSRIEQSRLFLFGRSSRLQREFVTSIETTTSRRLKPWKTKAKSTVGHRSRLRSFLFRLTCGRSQ
jgi:hypothetical protein